MDKINRIKYCPKCGTKTLEGAEFCQKCGAKLIEGASVQTAASDSANSIQMPGRVSEAVPKKKKSKKLLIILAIVFVFIVILIIANADDWSESGKEYERQEEYIKSQQASADVESSENNTNKGLFCNDIPMDTIMKMSVEDVIDAFGTPDEQSESHIAFYSEGILAEFDSQGFVEAWGGNPEKFEMNGRNLNQDYDGLVEIFGREPDCQQMFDLLEVKWFYDNYSILLGLDSDGLPGKIDIRKKHTVDQAQQLVYDWIESTNQLGIIYPEYIDDGEIVHLNDGKLEVYNFRLMEGDNIWIPIAVEKDTGEMWAVLDNGDIMWLYDYYNAYYENDAYAYNLVLDEALYGRWRSTDGGVIELSDTGYAQTSLILSPWWAIGRSTALSWEASNGQLKLITSYAVTYDYQYYPKDWEDEYYADHLRVGPLTLHRVNGNTGDSMIGVWDDNDMGGPYFTFNEDGTGAFANDKPTTWEADAEKISIYYDLYTTFDYSVSGDMLTIFFSDGSKTYTRVGY